MTAELEIDEVLRRLGSVDPPDGLERRVSLRLQAQRTQRISAAGAWALATLALVAGLALAAILLTPALRNFRLHAHSDQRGGIAVPPRVAVPAAPGGFGAASAVHVPAGPVAVPPTPVNQGRGRSRSGATSGPQKTMPPAVSASQPDGGESSSH